MHQDTLDALIESQFGSQYIGVVDTSHFLRVKGNTSMRFMHDGRVWVLSRETGKFYLVEVD